jgi:hypothetical protein
MDFDLNYNSIMVASKACKSCDHPTHYNPIVSSTSKPISKKQAIESSKYGNFNVQLYEDKVCVGTDTYCMKDFIFQSQLNGKTLDN